MQKASLGTVVTAIASMLRQRTNTRDDSFSSGRIAAQNGKKLRKSIKQSLRNCEARSSEN